MPTEWFLDTDFSENGTTIGRISLALISDQTEYYAIASDGWSPCTCNPWVQDNVIPKLLLDRESYQKTRKTIADDIKKTVL